MKKKFGIIISALLILVMLVGGLVACEKPKTEKGKDAKPAETETIDAGAALGEVFDAWVKDNSFKGGDILGWDMGFDYSLEGASNINIDFKGGITKSDKKDIFELTIAEEKAGVNTPLVGIIVDKDALVITCGGVSYEIAEINLAGVDISLGTDAQFNTSLETIIGLLSMAGGLMDDGTGSVTTTKVGDTYTKEYNVGIDIWSAVSSLKGLLEDALGVDKTNTLMGVLKSVFENNIIKIQAEVTDLVWKETKKDKEDTIFYTYAFKGGKITPAGITAGLQQGEVAYHKVALTGLGVINTLPAVVVPTKTTPISLLKHQITGEFSMNSTDGIESTKVAKYTYKMNIEFDLDNIVPTIIKCINEKSADAIIDKIFSEQKGKIYFDIFHKCEAGCVPHLAGTDFDGSIFTLAYDPSEKAFNNTKVNVAAHLRAIIPADLFDSLGFGIVAGIMPEEYISFAIDPLVFTEISKAEKAAVKTSQNVASVAGDKNPIDISAVIKNILAGFTSKDGIVSIDFNSITDVLLTQLGLEQATVDLISKAIASLFPEIDTMSVNAVYANGAKLAPDFNGLTAYMAKNADVEKQFIYGQESFRVMLGDYSYAMTEKSVNINSGSVNIGNGSGKDLPMSYNELMSIPRNNSNAEDKSTVSATYKTFDGADVTADLMITDIIGLDPKKIGTPQTIKLVVSGADGSYLLNFLNGLAGMAGMIGVDLSFVRGISLPVDIIETEVTLTGVEKSEWTQKGIGTDANHIDTAKTYVSTDKLVVSQDYIITYVGGKTKTVRIDPNDVDKLFTEELIVEQVSTKDRAFKTFAPNTLTYVYGLDSKEIELKFDVATAIDKQSIKMYSGLPYTFGSELDNKATEAKLVQNAATSKAIFDAFVKANPENASYTKAATKNAFTLTIKTAGTYCLTIVGEGKDSIEYTIEVLQTTSEKVFEGTNTIDTKHVVYNYESIAIGLKKTETFNHGGIEKTVITSGFVVTNNGSPATAEVDYVIDEDGIVTFKTVGEYIFTYTENEVDYFVYFSNLVNVIEINYKINNPTGDSSENPLIDQQLDKPYIKIEISETRTSGNNSVVKCLASDPNLSLYQNNVELVKGKDYTPYSTSSYYFFISGAIELRYSVDGEVKITQYFKIIPRTIDSIENKTTDTDITAPEAARVGTKEILGFKSKVYYTEEDGVKKSYMSFTHEEAIPVVTYKDGTKAVEGVDYTYNNNRLHKDGGYIIFLKSGNFKAEITFDGIKDEVMNYHRYFAVK